MPRWKPKPQKADPAREEVRDERRRLILATAAKLFIEKGFHETSIDDIANKLNVSKPTIYYYVKNKDDILFEAISMVLQDMDAVIQESLRDEDSPPARLRVFFHRYAEQLSTDMGLSVALIDDRLLSAQNRKQWRILKRGFENRALEIVVAGVKEGSIRAPEPKLLVYAIFGAINWMARWYGHGGRLSVKEISQLYLSLFENGYRTDAKGPKQAPMKRRPASKAK